MSKVNYRIWTDEEIEILKMNFNKSIGELLSLLPKRSNSAIRKKIDNLNLPREKQKRNYIDIDEILKTYDKQELVIYKNPVKNRRDIVCLKKNNLYLESDCHVVISHHKDKDGYAEMSFDNKRGKERIHRYIFDLFNEKIKEGNVVRHMCHNPSCCNPEHLKQGTFQDNSDDMKKANRTIDQKGSLNHGAILTEEIARNIKIDYKNGMCPIDLVRKYDLKKSTVNNIIYEYQWKHVVV